MPIITTNPPRPLCWKCGLASGELDLAGCTMDILSAHDFVDPGSRPFADWTYEEVGARYGRACLKARSALDMAHHLRSCPAAGPGGPITLLYEQKAMKRGRLALWLWEEIVVRIEES